MGQCQVERLRQTYKMLDRQRAEPRLFHLSPVEPRSLDRSFALAKIFEPRLDLAAWRSYVRQRTRHEAGVMSIGDQRGYLHGFFSWCLDRSLVPDRILRIQDVILITLPGNALQLAVIEQISELAHAKSCRQIIMGLEMLRSGLSSETLEAMGFHRAGTVAFSAMLCRQ